MFLMTGWFSDASDKEWLQALIKKARKQGFSFHTQALFTNKLVMHKTLVTNWDPVPRILSAFQICPLAFKVEFYLLISCLK